MLILVYNIPCRFPSSVKASKQGKIEVASAKGSLMSGKLSPPQSGSPAQPQPEVDLNLSAKLFSALRLLRTVLLKEVGDGVMAYHIFGNATLQHLSKRIPRSKEELLEINGIGKAKVSKYGDRLLETIESTIREYSKADRNSSGSNESSDSVKRRRDASKAPNGNLEEDDEFTKSTGQSKKRTATRQNKVSRAHNSMEPVSCNRILDDDLDFNDSYHDPEANAEKQRMKRVLLEEGCHPGKKVPDSDQNMCQEYAFNSHVPFNSRLQGQKHSLFTVYD